MKLFSSKSRQKVVLGFAASALLLLAAACSREKSDAQIIGEVSTRIQRDAQVPNKNVAIMSNKGVVTLNGTANSDAERLAASNDASQVEGVKTVVNNLTVAPPAPQLALEPAKAQLEAPAPSAAKLIPPPARDASNKPSAYHAKRSASVSSANKPSNTSDNSPVSNTGIVNTSPLPAPATTTTASSNSTTSTKSDAILIPPPPLPVKMITIDSGTPISVRLAEPIDSSKNRVGDTFRASLDAPIYAGDEVAVPSGATVIGRIVEVQDSGHFTGRAQLALELTSLSVNGRRYSLQTNRFTQQGNSQGSRTAKTVGGGAAIGALIGAIAGGGKGAAIGAGAGAAGGGAVQAARGTQPVRLASEARLNFRLEGPLSVSPTAAIDRGNTNSDVNYSGMNQPASNGSYHDDYPSSDSNSSADSDRPVLKRRPPPNSSDSSNQPN